MIRSSWPDDCFDAFIIKENSQFTIGDKSGETGRLLVEAGALHAVWLQWKSVKRAKKKIAAAVYKYQADCDGEWDTMISK